jgi:hypothetical protein
MVDRGKSWQWIQRIARLAATILTLWVAYFAVRLLIVGQKFISVGESELPPSPILHQVYFKPYPLAYGYLPAILLLLVGLWVPKRSWLAWIGWAWLGLWSWALLFSSGAALIPAVVLLLVCLMILLVRDS